MTGPAAVTTVVQNTEKFVNHHNQAVTENQIENSKKIFAATIIATGSVIGFPGDNRGAWKRLTYARLVKLPSVYSGGNRFQPTFS